MKSAFIVCSRLDSSRIYQKPLRIVNGRPLITHLVDRLSKVYGVDTILAIPETDRDYPRFNLTYYDRLKFYYGQKDNPLQRMYEAADKFQVDNIIRVTHDKTFIEPKMIYEALDVFNKRNLDYLYSPHFTEGTGFEIISKSALMKASMQYMDKDVEHVSYAIKSVTNNVGIYDVPKCYRSKYRFLIDYPEDLELLEIILSQLGNDCSLTEALKYRFDNNVWLDNVNKLPEVTVYTCAYKAEETIVETMKSVLNQMLVNYEYIIVDDFSPDKTLEKIYFYKQDYHKVKVIRNPRNLGLSSSCNVALKHARGKYIVRLDADDCFVSNNSLRALYNEITETKKDIIYPNNYYGNWRTIQKGNECHHVGGAIFNKRALNHLKFTDGLRGLEGYDLFIRARDQLDIGYLNTPIFFYTQREDSMSHTNLDERSELKKKIDETYCGAV